jgi:hypothetical protein
MEIIIAANNEAERLPTLLGSIPRAVKPTVAANGCTDETAEIAESYGAKVVRIDETGKLNAIQQAMRVIGLEALSEGFATIDADCSFIFPNAWNSFASSFVRNHNLRGGYLSGPIALLSKSERFVSPLETLTYQAWWVKSVLNHNPPVCGANAVIVPDVKKIITDAIVEAPSNVWPGEDVFLRDMVQCIGGYTQASLNPAMLVRTSSRGRMGMRAYFTPGGRGLATQIREAHWDSRQTGAMLPYSSHKVATDYLEGLNSQNGESRFRAEVA